MTNRLSQIQALVLMSHDFQESSRMVEVFTREKGKLTLVCKGARRNKSPLLNLTEPYIEAEMNLIEGRSSYYLKDGHITDAHLGLRKSVRRMGLAAFSAELVRAVLFEGADEELFDFYQAFLKVADQAPDQAATSLAGAFLLKLSSLIGFRPSLGRCLVCSKRIQPPCTFDLVGGGMICEHHQGQGPKIKQEVYDELTDYILKSFEEIARNDENRKEASQKRAAGLALQYFQIHTERNGLKCVNLLQSLHVL